jgi:spermidine/putrescine transport system permease protein
MRRLPSWVLMTTMLALVLLYFPLLAVGVMSVNATRHGQTWGGFTTHWYVALLPQDESAEPQPLPPTAEPEAIRERTAEIKRFEKEQLLALSIRSALMNSLIVAVVSTAIATVLGTLLAIGLRRLPLGNKGRLAADLAVNLPTVTPDILLAAALIVAYQVFRHVSSWFDTGLVSLTVGHVTFQISFVAVVVSSRLSAIGRDQFEAARDLYASSSQMWRRIILPQLAPGIVAGALLAFTLSLDDFVVSFFLSGPSSTTLPVLIYSSVKRGVTPQIHALSTLLVVATMLGIVALVALERRKSTPKA